VFLLLLVLPMGLDAKQHGLAAVLGLVVTWWITEAIPIPITGLVGLCLCVILNVASADDVFGSVADSTIFMLPIALGVMASVGRLIIGQVEGEERPERLRFGAALMLVITYGITVGGLLLPIGSPPT
jgi:di/tricarboxylate transporter